METHKRSLLKAVTWRFFASLITTVVVYLFTREVALSLGIGFTDAAVKILVYYAHERIWERINFGRRKATREDYVI